MADVSRRNKGRLDHVAHVKVTDPFGIFAVSLIPFMGFGVLGVGKGDKQPILLQDIKDRDPVFAGGFHADVGTMVFCKPVRQLLQTFGKGREAGPLILGTTVCIGDSDTGIDPGFVDIEPTTVKTKNFERQ